MSKKLLSFLLIACMLSSNMAVPASYAQTVNDGTANPNLEVTQDSAKSDDKVEAQGNEQDSSPAQKVEDGSTQGANTDENQNGAVEKKDEKDAQGNREQQTNPSVENQQNEQGNTGLTPSIPMVTVPDGQTPQGMVSDVLAQDTGAIINQLGEQQLAPAKNIADNLLIEGAEVGTTGDENASMETLIINLTNDGGMSFHEIDQNIVSVSIDDLNVPLRDEQDGMATFTMQSTNGNESARYMCFYSFYTGRKVIEDFKKRDKHKIVINFADGSTLQKIDAGYVRPEGRDENNGEKPKPPVTGNAAEYEIDSAFLEKGYGDEELKLSFKKGDKSKLKSLVKTVKVNGEEFAGSLFHVNWKGEYVTSDEKAVKKAKEKTPIDIEIIFKDGSVLSNGTTTGKPEVHKPRVVNGYILTKDMSKTSYVDKILTRSVHADPIDEMVGIAKGYQVKLAFKDLVIGNKTYKVKGVRYSAMGTFRDTNKLGEQTFGIKLPSLAIYPETSTKDTDLPIIVEFDKTPDGYDNPTKELTLKLDWNGDFKQPEEEKPTQLAEGYSITGTEFADNDKKFIINLNKEMPTDVFKKVKALVINGKTYNKEETSIEKAEKTIYIQELEDGSVVANIKAEGVKTVEIVFTDNSKVSFKNEEKPKPGKTIADNYSISGTKISGNKFVIELNKEMTDEHLSKLKSVTINKGTPYGITERDNKFAKEGNTIYHVEVTDGSEDDEDELFENAKNNVIKALELAFDDGSKVSYVMEDKPQPSEKLADKYVLERYNIDNTNSLSLSFKKSIQPEEIGLIKAVKINGKEFERAAYKFYADADTGRVFTANKDVVKQVEDNKYDLTIQVIFKDDSVSERKFKADKPDGGFAEKFKLTNAVMEKTAYSSKIILSFSTAIYFNDIKEIESVKINDKVFEKELYGFQGSWGGKVESSNAEVVKHFEQNQYDLKIEVKFKDGSITKYEKTTQKPAEKLADKFKLTKAEYEKTQSSKKFILTFASNMATEDVAKVETVKINGKDFAKEALKLTAVAGKAETQNAEVITQVENNKDNLKLEVVFNDKSVTKLDTKVEITENSGLTIDSNLPDGDYTLTFKAYMEGSNQAKPSTLEGFFDKRVKLNVTGNKKTVSFLNHISADLILDFALQKGQTYVQFTKKPIETATNGSVKKMEYTVELDELTGTKLAAVLGSGPMGGSQGDVGQYNSDKYKKAEIVFEKAVTKGWTDYKVIEDEKNQKLKNDLILTEALIENGLDTNKDDKISVDELRNAVGRDKPKSIAIDGFPMTNVIDLEGKGITDISILKDLGPQIRGINLNGNKIEELPKGVFDNATGVTHLILGANKIRTIDKDVFKKLDKLRYIDFDGNPLVSVPEGLFDANTKLTMLSLMNTALEGVPDNLIKNNKALTELYLQDNKIKRLPDDFFSENSKLTRLTISSSQLENLPSSLGENKLYLSIIQANNNNITSIPASFASLKNVTEIELSNNKISEVPDEFFVNMIKVSKSKELRLKLGSNNIKSIPVDKMVSALNDGKEIKFFQVGMNMLPMDISNDEKAKLKKIGVSFDDESYAYYPQRTAIKATAKSENGKLKLEQNIDILELYFWQLSDIVNREKKMFTTENEFLNYLKVEGRYNNGVSTSLPRDEAIAKILSNKDVQWKVNTVITKGNDVVYSTTKENEKEGINQEFNVANLQKDEQYTITKTMYVYVPSWQMWRREVEYSTSFTAQEENDKFEEVKVKINRENSNEPSVANNTIKPVANLEKVGDKFRYTLFFKPMNMNGISGEIGKFFIKKDGKYEEVVAKAESGEYNKSFTFELDKKVDKLPVAFEIAAMGGSKIGADIIFEYSNAPKPKPPVNQDEKTVKGYILNADGKSVSMADKSIERDVKYKKIDKKAGPFNLVLFTVKFNEMTMGQQKAGVDGLYVKLKGQWMEAKAVEGQKGVFTFEMLENAVRPGSNIDTMLDIKFKVGQHSGTEREAKLLLDWNGDFNGTNANPKPQPNPNPNPNPQEQVFDVNVSLKQADTNKDSMASGALDKKARVEYKNGVYKYTLTFKPLTMGQPPKTLTGKVTKFAIMKNGVREDLVLVENGENKTVSFELNERVEKLRSFVLADIMEQMGMSEQAVDVVFDWTNAPKPPAPSKLEMGASLTEENGVVIARIDEQEAIANIEKLANAGTLTIKVNSDVSKPVQVVLPKAVLQKASDKDISIEIVMPTSKVTLSKEVVSQLTRENDVKLSVKKADLTSVSQKIKDIVGTRPAVDIEVNADNKKISQFEGNIKLAIPYVKKSNEDNNRIKIYYVRDNENAQVVNGAYYDVNKNEVVFNTNHFSVYAVGYDNTTTNPSNPGKPNTGGGGGGGGGGGSSSSELKDGTHMINVWLRKTGTNNELSMASKALSKTAKVVKSGNHYTYTINFVPLEFNSLTGNVTKFYIDRNGRKTEVNGVDGEYTFSFDEKLEVLKVYVYVDIMGGERDAEIVFDWNGTKPAPAESAKIETKLKAQAVLVNDETKPSILNAALNPNAKMIQEGGKYKYVVEFKKVTQGNKSEDVESLGLRVSSQETTPIKPIKMVDSQYTRSFTFEFDKKQDKIQVSFKFDNINTDEREAYIVFKDAKADKTQTKTQAKAKTSTLKDKVEKVLSKAEAKYYTKETLAAIKKAYDEYNKGDKKAEEKLNTLLETARIEKITYVLEQGYMAGYDGNVFKPNDNISIAEAAVMFAQLVDEEAGEIKNPAVKTKHWYTDAVNKMVALSYIKVKDGEELDPNRAITRAEYAYIVAKLRNYPASETNLSDIGKDYWARAEISSLVAKGVINGYKDKTFKPENTITRAEAVTIVSRAFPTKADISKKKKFADVSEKHWAYQYIMAARKN